MLMCKNFNHLEFKLAFLPALMRLFVVRTAESVLRSIRHRDSAAERPRRRFVSLVRGAIIT